MTNCPFHKGGQERKASFGIGIHNMACHCFSCGWTGTLTTMISEMFGSMDGGRFGEKWLSKHFLSVSIETRQPLQLNFERGRTTNEAVKGFTEAELDEYRYIHPYMYKRGLTDEIIETFDIGFDVNTDCITFPVYDVNKNPAFIARRSVCTKFFNYPTGVEKPVYCAERFVGGEYRSAIICESFFNTLTCWKHGQPSVALMGLGTESQYAVLRRLPVRKYILAMDSDEAGYKASMKLKKALQGTQLVTFLQIPVGKDVNDCDDIFHTLKEMN